MAWLGTSEEWIDGLHLLTFHSYASVSALANVWSARKKMQSAWEFSCALRFAPAASGPAALRAARRWLGAWNLEIWSFLTRVGGALRETKSGRPAPRRHSTLRISWG